jgi:hypothetical protein
LRAALLQERDVVLAVVAGLRDAAGGGGRAGQWGGAERTETDRGGWQAGRSETGEWQAGRWARTPSAVCGTSHQTPDTITTDATTTTTTTTTTPRPLPPRCPARAHHANSGSGSGLGLGSGSG